MTLVAPDQDEREIATDISRSVIVQAPAGSGKTTLLVERYLRLLAVASQPEEILAITFTEKAAKNMHEQLLREQPLGQTFNTITNGVRNMSGYAAQIPTEDRWAIVAYVKALQRSQAADLNDLPPDQRIDLRVIKLHPEEP